MRSLPAWGLLIASLALPQLAFAQLSDTVTGGGDASLQLNLNINVEQTITLELSGNTVDPSTSLSSILAGTSADIDFGTVNTACSVSPSTGACYRLNDESGARFVATIDARVTATGEPTPGFDLGLEASPALGVEDKLYRECGGDGSCPGVVADTFWRNPANGISIPDVGLSTGTELASAEASGSVIEHQLALEVLDSQGAGALSIAVTYTASPN